MVTKGSNIAAKMVQGTSHRTHGTLEKMFAQVRLDSYLRDNRLRSPGSWQPLTQISHTLACRQSVGTFSPPLGN